MLAKLWLSKVLSSTSSLPSLSSSSATSLCGPMIHSAAVMIHRRIQCSTAYKKQSCYRDCAVQYCSATMSWHVWNVSKALTIWSVIIDVVLARVVFVMWANGPQIHITVLIIVVVIFMHMPSHHRNICSHARSMKQEFKIRTSMLKLKLP